MERETNDTYFVYQRQRFGPHRSTDKFLIDSFKFEDQYREYHHKDFRMHKVTGNQFVKLFCTCGACDFDDQGRYMHEYQCNCCGKYVTVYRRNVNEEARTEEES